MMSDGTSSKRKPESDAETETDGLAVEETGPPWDDAATARQGSEFDPTPYLRQLRGRGGGVDYLDVKWRLLWLRKEHPDAEIVTDLVQHDPQMAIFKATVTLPTGGKATGYGSETASDFPDFIEKAETKAIGRALNALGYGAQFGEVPSPVQQAAAPASSQSREQPDARPAAAAPAPVAFAQRVRQSEPRREPASTPATSVSEAASSPAATDAELVEYSWSAFWPWARERGLNGPKEVEILIGQPVAGLSPAELRNLIAAADSRR
jgi:hypothetical protein